MIIYRARPGDTVTSVARHHGILPTAFATENGLTVEAPLAEGQALLVSPASKTYHVKEGDTLRSIARHHGCSPARLCQLNPALGGGDGIYPGMTLTLGKAAPPRGTLAVTGIVAAGTPDDEVRPILPYLTFLAVADGRIGADGTPTLPDDSRLIALTRAAGVVPLLLLRADGETPHKESETCRRLFSDGTNGESLSEALVPRLAERGYGGLLLDLPFLPKECLEPFRALVMRLRRRLGHSSLVMVTHTPPVEPPSLLSALPLAPLGRAAGALSLSTYDFASRYGAAAPCSPYDKVRAAAEAAARGVRPQKLFLGITTQAHEYPVGGRGGRVLPAAEAPTLAARQGGFIGYDPLARLPYASFEEEGERRILFFEDVGSFLEKLLLVESLGLGGITLFPAVRMATPLLLGLASGFRIVKLHGE